MHVEVPYLKGVKNALMIPGSSIHRAVPAVINDNFWSRARPYLRSDMPKSDFGALGRRVPTP